MNYTERFKLSQWDKSDQIRMEDFNADNAKIDAALAAASSSSNSLGRSQLLSQDGGYPGSTAEFGQTFDPAMDWNDWEYVAFLVSYPSTASQSAVPKFRLDTKTYRPDEQCLVSPLAMPGYLVVLLPRHNAAQHVSGFAISDRLVPFSFDFDYTELDAFACVAGSTLLPYPNFEVYGAK